MTNYEEHTATERTELIQRAYKLTGDLHRTEKLLYELRQAQAGIAITLVKRYKLSVTEAGQITGMPRQRVSQEIRMQDLRDDTGVQQ